MTITKYKAVESTDIRLLNEIVNTMIDDNWQPKDRIIVVHENQFTRYIQVMYK